MRQTDAAELAGWGRRVLVMAALVALICLSTLDAMSGSHPAEASISGTGATHQEASASRLSVVQQTSWVEPGQGFDLSLAVSSKLPRSQLYLAVAVFGKLSSRSAFDQTLRNRVESQLLRSFDPVPVTGLPPDSAGHLLVHIPVTGVPMASIPANRSDSPQGPAGPFSSLNLGSCPDGCGVFPLRVELADSHGNSLDQFTTHLVRTDPSSGSIKLGMSWIVPVHSPPSLSSDGRTQLPAAWSSALSALASNLADCPAVPLTLAPTPETLEALISSSRPVDQATVHTLATVASGGTTPLSPPGTPRTALDCPAASSAGGTTGAGPQPQTAPGPASTPSTSTSGTSTPPPAGGMPASPSATPPQGAPPGPGLTQKDQVATLPYVPIDLPSLAAAGLGSEVQAQLDRATEVLRSTLAARRQPLTWVSTSSLDQASLQRLHTESVEQLVVPETSLSPAVDQALTPTNPFELMSGNLYQPLTVTADTGLASHFTNGPDQVLAAHQLLADLAEIYFDRPADVQPRGVVVQAPLDWLPNQSFLHAFLGGLAASPVVSPITLDDLFRVVPSSGPGGMPLFRRLTPHTTGVANLPAGAVLAARQRLDSFFSVTGAETPIFTRLEDLLLTSETAGFRSTERKRYLNEVQAGIGSQLARLALPQDQRITLTAQTGRIPITIISSLNYPVHAVLAVSSDGLSFPNGSSQSVVLDTRDTSRYFEVKARTSGAFPLRVSLVSPDGNLPMLTSRFTIHSTAASGVAIALSAGAAAFLLGWWGRSARRGRRDRNRRLVPGAGGVAGPSPRGGGADGPASRAGGVGSPDAGAGPLPSPT
ncbi:MAG: hypothetical protein DLM54_01725 [Acidimicrobiales bacterium]|nr:MAG: hypothetical protein DLM54_01725 [Acidimicrobiales bacterium]